MEQWMNSPYVECWVDYDEVEEIEINEKLISWFDIKFNLSETEEEKKEKQEAIREQIQAGVLLPNGIPPGVQMPPPPKIMTREQKRHLNLLQKREQKKQQRQQFVHPIRQETKEDFQLSPLALKIKQQMTRGKRHDQ